MSKQDLIGQTCVVRFPEVTDQVIKARVDTGAQTSAIWVSNIRVEADGIHVNFLGNEKGHIVSEALIFTEYKRVRVHSSNSLFESRYKVKLQVVINNRRIRSWFTLTDRSKRTYPVLIGRNVLYGKFLVDVSHKPQPKKVKEV